MPPEVNDPIQGYIFIMVLSLDDLITLIPAATNWNPYELAVQGDSSKRDSRQSSLLEKNVP